MARLLIQLIFIIGFFMVSHFIDAQEVPGKVKDFRGTSQSIALLGAISEFVDPAVRDQVLMQVRRYINRYSRSYGESSIANFKLGQNLNDQFFRPSRDTMSDVQKAFLKAAAKDNAIDIIVLSSIRESGENTYELELQLFDARIETLSAIEKTQFNRSNQQRNLEELSYRMMNYMDKEGFVHPTAQNYLDKPIGLDGINSSVNVGSGVGSSQEYSVSPTDLSGGSLAGPVSIAGEKTPFWEKWWFWALVGGGLASAGAATYYFVVVDQDPSQGNITFRLP